MSGRTQEAVAFTDLVLEVFRLNGALLEAGNRITGPHGLTSARWQVMGAIDLEQQAMTVAQIARRMGLARQSVQRIVNDLEELGLIELEDNIDHKRAKLVAISTKGKRALSKVDKAQIEWANELSDGLSQRQLKQALKLLNEVRARCTNENDDE